MHGAVQLDRNYLLQQRKESLGLAIGNDSTSLFSPDSKLSILYNDLEMGAHDTVYASGFKRVDQI